MLEQVYSPLKERCAGWCLARDRYSGRRALVGPLHGDLARARAAQRLPGHPSVLRLRDVGVAEHEASALAIPAGGSWQALAAPAGAWRGLLEAAADLSATDLLGVAVQALLGLDHLHRAGLVRGDLVAGSLLISTSADAPPRAVWAGLGSCEGATEAAWAAPERRAGAPGDSSSDLAGLGLALLAALEHVPGEHELLGQVACRLAHDDPAERYSSASAALRQLEEWAPELGGRWSLGLPEPAFQARSAQLRQLLDELLPPAGARWTCLVGEPGVGRGRLLLECGHRLRLRGVRLVEVEQPDELGGVIGLAGQAPLLVVVRDLDRASAGLVDAVARLWARTGALPPRARLGLATTLAVSPDQASGLAPLLAQETPRQLRLEPLSERELRRLAARALGRRSLAPELVEVLWSWTGGSPGLLRRALEHLREQGVVEPAGAGQRVHLGRLAGVSAPAAGDPLLPARLGRDTRRALRALALAPGTVSADVLGRVVGLAGTQLSAALAPLLETGVLRGDERLGLGRETLRGHVLEGLRTRERAVIHRAFLAELGDDPAADQPERALAQAHHALGARDAGLASRFVPAAAANLLEGGSARLAARLLEGLLEVAPKLAPAARVAALEQLGSAYLKLDEPARAAESFAQALATRSPKVTAATRVALHRRRGAACLATGDLSGAAESLARARQGIGDDAGESAGLASLEAQLAVRSGRMKDALALTRGALEELAEAGLGRAGPAASLWNLRGVVRFHLGDLPRARRLLLRSLGLCRALEHRVGVATVLGNLALVAGMSADAGRARRLLRRSRAVARRAGSYEREAAAWLHLGNLANDAGRLREARRCYRRSLALHARHGGDRGTSLALSSLGDSFLAAGEPRRARRYFARAEALARTIRFPYEQALAQVNLADALAALGDLVSARRLLEGVIELRRTLGEPGRTARALALASLVEALLGDGDAARRHLSEAEDLLGGEGVDAAARGAVWLARARVLLEEGGDDAEVAADRARQLLSQAQVRQGVVEAQLLRGEARLCAGQPGARLELDRARVNAEALGARQLALRAQISAGWAALREGQVDLDARLDALRAARSAAHWLGLAEEERACAGVLGALLEALGRADEAGVERLVARGVVDRLLRGWPLTAQRAYRGRPAVQRDCGSARRSMSGSPPRASRPVRAPAEFGLIGRSPGLVKVVDWIERFAPAPTPVLIRGETGTGKELVARALHAASPRREGPFVAVDVGTLPDELVAAELFGAAAGAYTGVSDDRIGLFELADGGTLFLDEIASASPAVQGALLRVLEEGRLRPVGGEETRAVDVRVLAAAPCDLQTLPEFRSDLVYRLSGLTIEVPPLRERSEDVPLLARHFLRLAQSEGRGSGLTLSPPALEALSLYAWPGNVRELRNAIERGLALAQGTAISAEDLGLDSAPPRRADTLARVEREAILDALGRHATLTGAARSLGIDRRTLGRRLKKHGIER